MEALTLVWQCQIRWQSVRNGTVERKQPGKDPVIGFSGEMVGRELMTGNQ